MYVQGICFSEACGKNVIVCVCACILVVKLNWRWTGLVKEIDVDRSNSLSILEAEKVSYLCARMEAAKSLK